MSEKTFYVYILASKKNGVLYIGVTNNLLRRVLEHKDKIIEGFSSTYRANKLVYFEIFKYVKDAINREKKLKDWHRDWKIRIIEEKNKEWKDLFYDLFSKEEIELMKEVIVMREEEKRKSEEF
jgi:putative endonuclease